MTIKDHIKKLDKQLKLLSDAKLIFGCVTEAHRSQVDRIFVKGQAGDGGKIGNYNSSDPIYVNPNDSPKKFPPKGKTGSKFKNGKPHKTGYFDSYKAFRSAIGRQSNFVNLRLTENLKLDFTNSLQRQRNSYITGIKRNENVGKVDGAIDRYGLRTFLLTKKERTDFNKCARKQLHAALSS